LTRRLTRPERKRRVLAKLQQHLPDPVVYNGHDYTACFRVDDELIVMNKGRDGTVELVLTCDSSIELFSL
jgi:ABC-type sugar transport system ATPase subunit